MYGIAGQNTEMPSTGQFPAGYPSVVTSVVTSVVSPLLLQEILKASPTDNPSHEDVDACRR